MKRIFTYIFIIAVALTASVSCSREYVFEENGQDGFITLRLQTAEMGTRVTITDGDPVDGEELENVVKHADFFFFKNEDGTGLLDHKRLVVKTEENADGELIPVTGQNNLYEYTFDVRSENNPLQGPSYVYVIANYPEEIEDGEITSLDDVLDLDIPIDLSKEFDSFVMDSYDSAADNRLTYLSPSKGHDDSLDKDGNVKYTIGLSRAAAKLVLSFKVAKSYTDAAQNVWTPVTDQMWWNFLYVRKSGMTVEAEPLAYDAKTNYFNTAQLSPVENGDADDDYTYWTTSAVYTYPQSYKTDDVTAPYYKLFCPWTCEKKGMNNFYYKVVLPDLNVDEEGNNFFKRNKVYQLMVDVSVIGGTEEDWALLTDHIYVADWWAPEKIEASFEGAMYLDVPVKEFTIYGDDFIDIPVVSSNLITVTGVTGTKTNLYTGNSESVTPAITNITKEGFRLTHVLNTDITTDDFDCTPITYTMTVNHATGGMNKPITVKVTQYPSIWVKADESNGYAYVNSYTYGNTSYADRTGTARGGRWRSYQNGDKIGYMAYNNNGDQLASMNQGDGLNSNYNQYIVNVSVLPQGYKVAGMTEDVVIGDPRGGELTYNYLGYSAGTNGGRVTDVKSKYKPASSSTQNVIAPVLRIASSWGATIYLNNFDRAEERCAAYQENGYPAGRWRLPTVAEIDFLIQLSTYEHIPALFTTNSQDIYQSNRDASSITYAHTYYSSYWSNGPSVYAGKPYTDNGHTSPYELGGTETSLTAPESESTYGPWYNQRTNYGYYWWVPYDNDFGYAYIGHEIPLVTANSEYFEPHVRCVYDEWYWSDQKYGNNGQPNNTAATQWLGYIY